jgi:uncharacterized protein (DUF2147 family)
MNRLTLLAVAAGACLATTAPALASPEGRWELETKDTQFELVLCGDGTELCGKLAWLSDAEYNDQYLPYLDKPMATKLQPDGPRRWKGRMQLFGHSFQGTISQDTEDQMTLSGCAFLVVCKTYEMYRVTE